MKQYILYYFLEELLQRSKRYNADKLRKLQKKRLRALRKTLANSPFYCRYSNKDLTEIPITNKADFMANFDTINTVGISKKEAFETAYAAEQSRDFSSEIRGITIGLSSGTSGNRGIFLASKKERALWVANVLGRVIGWSRKKRKVAFFLRANSNLYESVKSRLLSFSFFDIQEPIEVYIDKLHREQFDIIVAQPSVLKEIVRLSTERNIRLKPQKVISVAEVLTPEDREIFEDFFAQKIHEVYQCTEGFLAATCEQGVLHFNEDNLIIEKRWLDEEKTRFHPIITDLRRQSQPVVRYELNDVIVAGEPCKCGQKTLTIAAIEGRSDDVFYFENKEGKKISIFPDFIRRTVAFASENIQEYVVIQSGERQIDCYLKFTEEQRQETQEKVRKAFAALFEQYNLKPIELRFQPPFQHKRGDKMRRVQRKE